MVYPSPLTKDDRWRCDLLANCMTTEGLDNGEMIFWMKETDVLSALKGLKQELVSLTRMTDLKTAYRAGILSGVDYVDKWFPIINNTLSMEHIGSPSKRASSAVNTDEELSPSSSGLKDMRGDSREQTDIYIKEIFCTQCIKSLGWYSDHWYNVKCVSCSQPKKEDV